ncbi:MAG TPA: hypothetical protein VMU50_00435 [Polyangia bacterium]|nr:hypothetical protein [Polyangia bacterium]
MTGSAATVQTEDEIEASLAQVAELLNAGEIEGAAAAAQRLAGFCRAAAGRRLDPDQVSRMRELLQRCTELADTASAKLNTSLRRFSVSGRARRAYGDR